MSGSVLINEVGLRDGLQNQKVAVSLQDKLRLAQALVDSGIRAMEATSFVSPRAVPQMADADELFPGLPGPGRIAYSALVPNLRGLERAVRAGVSEVALVLSATETMNRRNINMGLEEATVVCEQTIVQAREQGIRAKAYVAVAFHCPFEGPVDPDVVLALGERMFTAGAQEVTIADTIGAAAPTGVFELLRRCVGEWDAGSISVHLHDTRALGLANAWAALQTGIRKFDASIGGIGGCPFAPGAAGNVATEDLVVLFEGCGYDTGIDLQELKKAVAFVGDLLGQPVGGRSSRWLALQDGKKKNQDTREQ